MAEMPQAVIEIIPPPDLKKFAVTVWKDGTYRVWGAMDAYYARNDPDWLAEFGVSEIVEAALAGGK
jgi:hypothetical protein